MFAQRDFRACIDGQLKERGFGAKRGAEILENFDGLTARYRAEGYGNEISQSMAMSRVFDDLATKTRERAKRAQKTLEVTAETMQRVADGAGVKARWYVGDGGHGIGAGLVRSVIDMIDKDARFSGLSAEGIKQSYRNRYWNMLADGLDAFGKGAFGTQRGNAGLYDIAREVLDGLGSTGNKDAEAFAKSYLDLNKVMVADRNNAGGSLGFLDKYMPQKVNNAKIVKSGLAEFTERANRILDWDRMGWPDGSPIAPGERAEFVKAVFDTLQTDGGNKIVPGTFTSRGAAMGNSLEDHRLLHFKDSDAWIEWHEAYGDGNVFDVIAGQVEGMAHKTAAVQQFGPNPSLWLDNAKSIVLSEASKLVQQGEKSAKVSAEQVIKNRLEPMFEQYMHTNAMSANSLLGNGVHTLTNVLTSAKMGSTIALALPGDFHQTLSMRLLNHMPLLDGMGTYFKGFGPGGFEGAQKIATQSGYIMDNLVGATYATERFGAVATYGPALSRRLSDVMIRASGLSRHTEIARWTAQSEMMGLLHRSKDTAYEDLPFTAMMNRYGIDKEAWDAARAVQSWSPQAGTEFLRPLDILNSGTANAQSLYQRMFTMIHQESLHMVPGSTLEASVTLRAGLRPDTFAGTILHSWGMFKNFPMTVTQMYGRLLLSEGETIGRLQFGAAMILGMSAVGYMGIQMREIAKGKTPLPNNITTMAKAALAGGGMSLAGDLMFGSVDDPQRGIANAIGGPLAGFANDVANLAFADTFKFVKAYDQDKEPDTKFKARLVKFLENNTPGNSTMWARLALQRAVWDKAEEWADPNIERKRQQQMRKQQKDVGNHYYSEPGSGLFGR